jgi:hypothetical protein
VPLSVPLAGDSASEKSLSESEFWKSEIILNSLNFVDEATDVDGENFKDVAHRIQVGLLTLSSSFLLF